MCVPCSLEGGRSADYWQARYVEAVLSTHAATSDDMRERYRSLAEHYLAMAKCVDREVVLAH